MSPTRNGPEKPPVPLRVPLTGVSVWTSTRLASRDSVPAERPSFGLGEPLSGLGAWRSGDDAALGTRCDGRHACEDLEARGGITVLGVRSLSGSRTTGREWIAPA